MADADRTLGISSPLAQRRYEEVDPSNRLVAARLSDAGRCSGRTDTAQEEASRLGNNKGWR